MVSGIRNGLLPQPNDVLANKKDVTQVYLSDFPVSFILLPMETGLSIAYQ